jgi:single-stranded-DNA-specific exonuclease
MSTTDPPPLKWSLSDPPDHELAASLAAGLSLPLPLAELLVQRGYQEVEVAKQFLRPALDQLADPYALAGMEAAVEAIVRAVRDGRPILVHGDYDVDGQCATALLTRALRIGGAEVIPFVPHRVTDGYDFGEAGLTAAREGGAGLILTCDCGINAVAAVAAAKSEGLDVIVTDHHLPGPELPAANAVIDPQQADDHSGLTMLCGTGVAFKLVQALVEPLGLPANLPFHLLDYVAMATVADIVPLVGENRILVKHGLKILPQSQWAGLRALLRVCDLHRGDIRAGQVGFILGPRINAVGRIGAASDGLQLLLTDDEAEARRLAAYLEDLNKQRQAIDQNILDQALELVEQQMDLDRDFAFVLEGEDWHPGVIGIVASRIVERYGRPTFLIAFDGDIGKGSGRSISHFDLHAALTGCDDLLERYGGHRMAAGLTIHRENLEKFRERFAALAQGEMTLDDLGPQQRVDIEIDLTAATDQLELLIRHLEPCGMGNPSPVFGVRGVELANRSVVGKGHLKGVLTQGGGHLESIGFQWADRAPWLGDAPIDAAFKLERNDWKGRRSLQARLVALAPAVVSDAQSVKKTPPAAEPMPS